MLFLDDERSPKTPGAWQIARSFDEAVSLLSYYGCFSYISFDHDLGDGVPTGHDLAKWLVDKDLDAGGKFIPTDFGFNVHSANPVGRANIEALLSSYLKHREQNSS